jgi:hypothetical protein
MPAMTSPAHEMNAWLEQLPATERDALARRYAAATAGGGAVVHKPDGEIIPIPPILSPEALSQERRDTMAADGHLLVVALGRLTAWLMTDAGREGRARLFGGFTPLESAGLEVWRHAERLATARVDYFLDGAGRARALEVNATIPAMQGYSDIVAESFLREVGAMRGHDAAAIARLVDGNGRNTDDLLAALVEHHRRFVRRDEERPLRMAIVHRPGDAQIGELRHYVRRFSELGHEVTLCTPEALQIDPVGRARLLLQGRPLDLVYRHIFARRLDPTCDLAHALLQPEVFPIFNPLSSHFEVKGMLGYISAAMAPDGAALAAALGLGIEEQEAIARILPWTRILLSGPTHGPTGERIADLVETVAGEPERFVIKRSWDYGGKSVFLGLAHDDAAAHRAGEVMGPGHEQPLSWHALVHAAARDPRDAWVVQEFVRTPERRLLLAGPHGAAWHEFYVDLSLYTNLGVDARPRGGATRASASRIVNILGGGGLAPLVREDVLAHLLSGPRG